MSRSFEGGCHCGAIALRFETDIDPAELPLRHCQCSFCRRHGNLSASDPAGLAEIRYARKEDCRPYRFGLGITDFHRCPHCGVFVAATSDSEKGLLAVINVNALDERAAFTGAPEPMDYDGEDSGSRLGRRAQKWTPATIGGGGDA